MAKRYDILEAADVAHLQLILGNIHYSKALHSVVVKPDGGFYVIVDLTPHSL